MKYCVSAIVLTLFCLPANAGLIPVPLDPSADKPVGALFCDPRPSITSGSYDAVSLSFQMSTYCEAPADRPNIAMEVESPGLSVEPLVIDKSLLSVSGFVGHDGEVIGGSFAWTGIILGSGIFDSTLLASGSLASVVYVPIDEPIVPDPNPFFISQEGLFALLEIEWTVDSLHGIAPFIQWTGNSYVGWDGCEDGIIGNCAAWTTSETIGGNFTSSTFQLFNRTTFVPEPGSLPMLLLGAALISFARKHHSRRATL